MPSSSRGSGRPARQAARPARPGGQRPAARRRAGGAAHPDRQPRRHGGRAEGGAGRGAAGLLDHRRRRPRVRGAGRGRPAGGDADRRAEDGARRADACSRAWRSSAAASTRPAPASRRSSARAPTASWCRCRASARPRSSCRSSARRRGCRSMRWRTARPTPTSGRGSTRRSCRRWTSPASSTCWRSGAVVTGEQLVDSQPSFDQNGRPAVTFRFNPTGGAAFGEYTAQNIGKPFAIVLDNQVISAPVIQAHIAGGSGIITGNFTLEEFDAARDPAARRRAAGGDHRARAADRRSGARRGLDPLGRHGGAGRLCRRHGLHDRGLRLLRHHRLGRHGDEHRAPRGADDDARAPR